MIATDGSTDLNYILVSHGVVEILVFLLLTLDVLWLAGPKGDKMGTDLFPSCAGLLPTRTVQWPETGFHWLAP